MGDMRIYSPDLSFNGHITVYFVVPSNDSETTEYSKKWYVEFYSANCAATELIKKDPSEYAGISWQFGSAEKLKQILP